MEFYTVLSQRVINQFPRSIQIFWAYMMAYRN